MNNFVYVYYKNIFCYTLVCVMILFALSQQIIFHAMKDFLPGSFTGWREQRNLFNNYVCHGTMVLYL